VRLIAVLLIVLLAACGASGQGSGEPSVDASVPGEPSVEASPSDSAPSGPLAAQPLGSVDGAPLGYLEYLPPGYGGGEPRPLLVFLHGAGEAGDGSESELDLVDKLGIPELIAAGDLAG
jgi:hypothetical protein